MGGQKGPRADIAQRPVCATSGLMHRNKICGHSITSLALASSDAGTVGPGIVTSPGRLRFLWAPGSQQDEENQLQRLPFPTRDHSAGDLALPTVHPGRTIERRTRISRPGDENARCRASRAEDHGHRTVPAALAPTILVDMLLPALSALTDAPMRRCSGRTLLRWRSHSDQDIQESWWR